MWQHNKALSLLIKYVKLLKDNVIDKKDYKTLYANFLQEKSAMLSIREAHM